MLDCGMHMGYNDEVRVHTREGRKEGGREGGRDVVSGCYFEH